MKKQKVTIKWSSKLINHLVHQFNSASQAFQQSQKLRQGKLDHYCASAQIALPD